MMKLKSVAGTMLILLLVSMFSVLSNVSSQPTIASMTRVGVTTSPELPLVSLNPMEYSASIGHSFTIDINITDVTNMQSYEFKLWLNNTILYATDVIPGPINPAGTTYALNHSEDETYVWVLATFPLGQAFTGNGTMMTINFTAIARGDCVLHLNGTVLSDALGQPIEHATVDGYVRVKQLGDVNGDGRVRADDIILVGIALFTYPGDPDYNPDADVNQDGRIGAADIIIIGIYLFCPTALIYFDKSIYFPDVGVFWEHNLSAPIGIKVIDEDVSHNSLKVNILSSIDSKEVTLTKRHLGVFCGVVLAVGIGMMGEPISNASIFSVRYGDEIIAEYLDTSSGMSIMASALFVFPHYVMEPHFVNLDAWKHFENIKFDSNGIPMVDYGSPIGLQYNPVTISSYALTNYHAYMDTPNVTLRETFLAQANWLVENAKQKGNYSVWEFNFDWSSYGCTDPWVSAMAQGEGLSVLARAYVLTGNTSFIDFGDMAVGSFEVEMSAGGVRYTGPSGVWFEECADIGAPSSKILNGFIYGLLGLYEYSFETNNSKGWMLFWEGTDTLSNNIYRYDTGSWSYYDLLHYNSASLSYHKLHIQQLSTMHKLTGDQTFLDYSNKFQSYMA